MQNTGRSASNNSVASTNLITINTNNGHYPLTELSTVGREILLSNNTLSTGGQNDGRTKDLDKCIPEMRVEPRYSEE